jgi:hypothetical protein
MSSRYFLLFVKNLEYFLSFLYLTHAGSALLLNLFFPVTVFAEKKQIHYVVSETCKSSTGLHSDNNYA